MSKANEADELMAELRGLTTETDAGRRTRRSWEITLQTVGSPELGVLIDFAVDNNLVQPLPNSRPSWRTAPPPPQSWLNPIDGSQMIWIPPGPFYVGNDRNRKRCEAPGFSLARHPVTNGQFAHFLSETGYTPPDTHPDPELFLSHWGGNYRVPNDVKGDHPVVWVSYIDALHYCRWAGLTLPTEWHWEKATRGPDGRHYPWGQKLPMPNEEARLANVYGSDTLPVGSFPQTRTPYGCEDMIGNVSEWCQFTANDDPARVPPAWLTIPKVAANETQYAPVRGSCFLRRAPRRMMSSHRRKLSISRRNFWTGFRPAFYLAWRPGT